MSLAREEMPGPDAGAWDLEVLRRDFPILAQRVQGAPLAYLDNAATSQKPERVIAAVADYYRRDNANVHRAVHLLAARATDAYEDARTRVAGFLNARSPSEIVFLRGTTEAINLVAHSFGQAFRPGDRVLLTTMEHHANIVPWQMLRDRKGHCFDGAVFAAAAFSFIGHPPLILDMIPNERDDDHVLTLFKQKGHWGACGKSNFTGLRFREPIHRNLRELMLSYFELFFNITREKTLRSYAGPLSLNTFDRFHWMTEDETMDRIARRLDAIPKKQLVTEKMAAGFSPVDDRSYHAGLLGADRKGLFRPPKNRLEKGKP